MKKFYAIYSLKDSFKPKLVKSLQLAKTYLEKEP